MDWTHRWTEISSVRPVENGVELLIGSKGKKMLGMFGSNEQQKKVLQIPQKAKREKLAMIMDKLKKDAP